MSTRISSSPPSRAMTGKASRSTPVHAAGSRGSPGWSSMRYASW
ncbi:hypothetical protein [Streptomyces luteolus]|uniref:Uncharacterized protein n=1 Tax=Streptomyces luteolus TaxID=3043615 RepID=A0ABT6SVQ8_9ACTN|nr:hypothetical protein [Streptomyces sp. B-S-A12]MDI3419476.1 hypothetical protein [Streptomyces sp. B-S-A12]